MAGNRIKVPNITEQASDALDTFREISKHPLLDGELIEDITLSTNTKKTIVYHGLGRAYRGFIDVRGVGLTEDQSNPYKNSQIWLYREAAPVLIDEVVTSTAVSAVTFSNLEGDSDTDYLLVGQVKHDTGSFFYLSINGGTANQACVEVSSTGSAVNATTNAEILLSSIGANHNFIANIVGHTGRGRTVHSTATRIDSGRYEVYSGGWNDTSTEITSLAINNASSGIGATSRFRLYSVGSRATKAAIWIF